MRYIRWFTGSRMGRYWHIEFVVLLPWLVWISYELYKAVNYLEIIAHGQ